ncbi:MAG: insulinase family protein [Sediminicola sp.]
MKNISKCTRALVPLYAFFCCTFLLYPMSPRDTMALDPGIRHGILPNGLTYYIKPTAKGSSHREIRLLVKGGSAVLDPDQYEMQHFLEHLAFTTGKNMTMAKMADLGLNTAQIGANTSYYYSQYQFKWIDSQQKQDIALTFFQDILWGLDLRDDLIDNERAVIVNELSVRGGFEAGSLLGNLENVILGRSINRPDDLVAHINTFPYEPLRRFYDQWYRPDLSALVVIGDIPDVDRLEKEIVEKFSKARPITDPVSVIKDFGDYHSNPPQFIKKVHPFLMEGSQKGTSHVRLYMRQKQKFEEDERSALQRGLIRQLFTDMLQKRFREELDRYMVDHTVQPDFLLPPSLGLSANLTIEGPTAKNGIQNTIKIFRQLEEYGFTEAEFKKGKDSYLNSIGRDETLQFQYWTKNIVDHFVYGEALPAKKVALLKSMLSGLTRRQFNNSIKDHIKTNPKDSDIIMLAPPGHGDLSYSEDTVRGWIAEAHNWPVGKYRTPEVPQYLMSPSAVTDLKEGPLKERSTNIPNTREYILANGIKVVLNSSEGPESKGARDNGTINFRAFTARGVGCYPQEDRYSAINAVDIVRNAGVGGLDKFQLKRYFGKIGYSGQVVPYIEYDEAGVRGTLTAKDLETSLQLVFLYFTAPNKDSLAFEDWKLRRPSTALTSINNKDLTSGIRSLLGDYTHIPQGSPALEGIARTDLDRAMEIYRELFGSGNSFTAIFSGDFTEEKILSLCKKYLGNLPRNDGRNGCADRWSKKFKLPEPSSLVLPSPEFMEGAEVALVYASALEADWTWKEQEKLLLLRYLLNSVLTVQMRYGSKDRGTYHIRTAIDPDPGRLFNGISFLFSSSKEDAGRLIQEIEQFVISFKNGNGADGVEWAKYLEEIKSRQGNEGTNSARLRDNLYHHYRHQYPWVDVKAWRKYIESVTIEDLQKMARRLLEKEPFLIRMQANDRAERSE